MISYPEPLVARVTNVNRATLASTRRAKLEKGTDWTLENSVTCYTATGLKKLLGALGLADAPLVWPDPATATRDPSATPPSAASEPEAAPAKNSSIALAPVAVAARVAEAGAVSAARPVAELIVAEISRNPTVLRARLEDGRLVLVRVRSNANFTPGMRLKARAPGPGGTLYSFEGQCPRWKGRF